MKKITIALSVSALVLCVAYLYKSFRNESIQDEREKERIDGLEAAKWMNERIKNVEPNNFDPDALMKAFEYYNSKTSSK